MSIVPDRSDAELSGILPGETEDRVAKSAPKTAADRTLLISAVCLGFLALLLFFYRLGAAPLFDLDEGLYATCAREMARTGDWVTPRLNNRPPYDPALVSTPFFEKPILIYWAGAASMRLLGASPLAARVPVALAALLTTLLVALAGARWFGRRAGLLAGVIYAAAPLTVVDARQLTTDGLLVLWLTTALLSFQRIREPRDASGRGGVGRYVLIFWIACALAVLTKGAAGLLLPFLVIGVTLTAQQLVFQLRSRGRRGPVFRLMLRLQPAAVWRPALRALALPAGLLLVAVLTAPWHLLIWRAGGRDELGHTWVQEYLIRQHIGRFKGLDVVHNAPLPSYLLYFLVGFFPWSCFTPAAFRYRAFLPGPHEGSEGEPPLAEARGDLSRSSLRSTTDEERPETRRFLLVWFWTIFLFFTLAAAKLPTYITPAYPAAALLVGRWLDRAVLGGDERAWRSLRRGALAAFITGLLLTAVVFIGPRFVPADAPIPVDVIHLTLHLTLLIAGACGLAWIFLLRPDRRRVQVGVVLVALTPVLLAGVACTEGYAVAARSVLGPYQQAAEDARPDAARGIPVVFYHIIPRRPSMLFYGRYAPLERKEAPLLPYLDRMLPSVNRVDVVTSRDVYDHLVLPEVERYEGASTRIVKQHGGWVLIRVDKNKKN